MIVFQPGIWLYFFKIAGLNPHHNYPFSGAIILIMISFIFNQIFHELTCFFRRWYFERSERFWAAAFAFLGVLDKSFAVAINARLWFQPLYGDYSPVGRVLGPILRTIRIVFGGLVYAALLVFAGLVWLVWLAAIPAVVFMILR